MTTADDKPLPESTLWHPKVDKRPARGLWAPGEYLRTCIRCREHFIADKQASHCSDCAYSEKDKP